MPANTTDSSQLKASSEDQNHDEMAPTNGDEQGYRPSDGPVSTANISKSVAITGNECLTRFVAE